MENLPKNWGDLKLNEVVSYKKGKKPKVLEEAVFDGAVPYLDIKAFEKNVPAWNTVTCKQNLCRSPVSTESDSGVR